MKISKIAFKCFIAGFVSSLVYAQENDLEPQQPISSMAKVCSQKTNWHFNALNIDLKYRFKGW